MVKTELLPTKENLINTFLSNAIDRNDDIADFVRLLNSVETSLSVAVDGSWGSGKTFFVKQTKMIFDSFNEYTQVSHGLSDEEKEKITVEFFKHEKTGLKVKNFVSVYFDAWEYDSDDEPIESLVYQISKDVSSAYKISAEHDYLGVASAVFDCVTGRKTKDLLKELKGKSIVEGTKTNKGLKELVNEFFDNLLPEHGERLVVFVDELDRCNPKFAVKLLERIKHYFTNENITFVFSVNKEQLQHTIKQHYGNDFDAYNYLDRFFDLTVSIPKCNLQKYVDTISTSISDVVYQVSYHMATRFNMSMRTVSHYIESVNIATKNISGAETGINYFCINYVFPFALALKYTDIDKYNSFMNGNEADLFKNILTENDEISYYIQECFYGCNSDEIQKNLVETYNAIFVQTPFSKQRVKVCNFNITKSAKEFLMKRLSLLIKNTSY